MVLCTRAMDPMQAWLSAAGRGLVSFRELWFVETPRHPPAGLAQQEVRYRKLCGASRLLGSQAAASGSGLPSN